MNRLPTIQSALLAICCWFCVGSGFLLRPTGIASIDGRSSTPFKSSTAVRMSKKIWNKQAELAKKLALAKEQKEDKNGLDDLEGTNTERLSNREIKERNDKLRFEQLLKEQSTYFNSASSGGYLTEQQEEAEIDAYERGLERLFEGDAAPTQPFEELVNIKSENAIGDTGMKRLVPWLKNTKSDYLIIVCDPRVQSPELREATKSLYSGLPKDMLSKMIIINADTPAENRRWIIKSNLGDLSVFSDEKREWMRSYSALGHDRWSMSMFVIADERIQKIVREMDALSAVKVTQNAVKAMIDRRL